MLALVPLALAAAAGGFVAEMLDPGRAGAFVWLYASSLLAGILLGALTGWRLVRSWGESLRDGWTEWMHSAVGAASMAEAAERAGAPRIAVGRLLAAGLVAGNAACLIAAWFLLPPFTLTEPYGALVLLTVAATGAAIGGRAAIGLAEAWWCREIEDQTLDLVQQGRVGVWGIR